MLHLSRLIFILIFILNMPIPKKSAAVPDRAFRMPWR